MGTRGAFGFRMDGQDKVMYNHFDSYPEGLGVDVLDFLNTHDVNDMRTVFPLIKLVRDGDTPTPEEKLACQQWTDLNVSSQSDDDWYCLLRDAQGDLSAFVDKGLRFMIDSQTFLGDSLFCEWAYIINLDENVLEIYEGFNTVKDAPGRYSMIAEEKGSGETFYGVKLIDAIPFYIAATMSKEQFCAVIKKLSRHPDEED
jgi:hypothetical protein